MKRKIYFKDNGILLDFERYTKREIQKDTILYLQVNKLYQFNKQIYYIMNGKGQIDIESMPHFKPTFEKIKLQNLDYYLQHKEHSTFDYEEQMQIESFYEIYDFNDTYKEPRIFTKEYNELEKQIYGIKENNNIKVERY